VRAGTNKLRVNGDAASAPALWRRGRLLTCHPRPAAFREANASRATRSDAAPLDNLTMDKAKYAVQSVHGHRLDWDEIPLRTPGKKD